MNSLNYSSIFFKIDTDTPNKSSAHYGSPAFPVYPYPAFGYAYRPKIVSSWNVSLLETHSHARSHMHVSTLFLSLFIRILRSVIYFKFKSIFQMFYMHSVKSSSFICTWLPEIVFFRGCSVSLILFSGLLSIFFFYNLNSIFPPRICRT